MRINRRIRLRIGNRLLALNFQFWNTQVFDRIGIRNILPTGEMIPFWDFVDNPPTPLTEIRNALIEIQKEYGLSTIYIIQSYPRQSYRAVCFDRLHFLENLAIVASTAYTDENFIRSLARRRFSVMRIVSKKEKGDNDRVIECLESYPVLRMQSKGHRAIFAKRFGTPSVPGDFGASLMIPRSRYESTR